jgi:hypothetical protein
MENKPTRPDREGVLKFDLDTYEGRKALRRAINADDLYFILSEIDEHLRQFERYKLDSEAKIRFTHDMCEEIDLSNEDVRKAVYEFCYGLRRDIFEIIRGHGIDTEDAF